MYLFRKALWLLIYFLPVRIPWNLGETISFGIAFKNISLQKFDSLKISFKIIDKNNVTHNIPFSEI